MLRGKVCGRLFHFHRACPASISSAIQIGPGQGKAADPAIGLDEQGLIDIEPARGEIMGRPRHVEPPDAIHRFTGGLKRALIISFEATDPVPKGQGVMLPKALHVANLEPRIFGCAECHRDGDELAVGEYIL